ncbi:MAG: HisA/HisF-related TIM barrel protein, partial [Pirellulales bacterium]|nr:HisA/HisF-related TIM barrel protein [Pirellulales bacterium]
SAGSAQALEQLCQRVDPARVVLGLDYFGGQLLGYHGDEADWLRRAAGLGVRRALVLDLRSVGTAAGVATAAICRRIRRQFPQLALLSGGGIRSREDFEELVLAGCQWVLIGTALHGITR